ncbi:DUF2231 domain-containing protein [Plastorhodobacter daqingensis]|uniref:DUF2231 domain-containing protein n=1 Tax=Plastorhodobacter daqingensis TaxID=1387281 RepID=A0ABW2UKR9_9RHOB
MTEADKNAIPDEEREDRQDDPNPVMAEIGAHDTSSAVALVGHPIHAMMVHFPIAFTVATLGADVFYWWSGDDFWLRVGLWAVGGAFATGVAAGLAGTAELLLVKGIRVRVASWTHAITAMMLISILGLNWGLRLVAPEAVLPHGIAVSALAMVFTGFAGWHGGKLVFDHGVGAIVSPKQ